MISAEHLSITHEAFPRFLIREGLTLSVHLKNANLGSTELKESAKNLLCTFSEGANLSNCLTKASSLVHLLIRDFSNSRDSRVYDEIIHKTNNDSLDGIFNHNQQVSTISVLIAIAVGGFSMEDFSDLATAGMLHDVGLSDINTSDPIL